MSGLYSYYKTEFHLKTGIHEGTWDFLWGFSVEEKYTDGSGLQCKHDQSQSQYADPLLKAAMCFKNFADIAILAFRINQWYIEPSISESCFRFTGNI